MRSRHPAFKGFWPAFWLLPENDKGIVGEIDIIEQVMHQPNVGVFTFHCNYSSGGATGFSKTNATYGSGFHTWGLQWTPRNLVWYVDGLKVAELNNYCIPNRPAYILANLAVGGGWPGSPNKDQVFPQYMEIDYIRAYKYVATGGISIPGPGQGISYTPVVDPNPALLALYNPVATPNNVSRGSKMSLTVKVVAESSSDVVADVSVFFISLTNANFNGAYYKNLINVKSLQSQNLNITANVPADLPDGFYRIGFNINSGSWNLYWQCFDFGVNRTVGKLDQSPRIFTAPPTKSPVSPVDSNINPTEAPTTLVPTNGTPTILLPSSSKDAQLSTSSTIESFLLLSLLCCALYF
eukprot:TRINITY_DN1163_c0_g1_i1.p1 TRINITY_DN1163_c0_g1~~TRINITY_DN1163_c0_g1_i1.p1  ORF type:complete len:352 (+),score=78.29 TRINITY_DN1163_c0_g1_i1:930-1985(+)